MRSNGRAAGIRHSTVKETVMRTHIPYSIPAAAILAMVLAFGVSASGPGIWSQVGRVTAFGMLFLAIISAGLVARRARNRSRTNAPSGLEAHLVQRAATRTFADLLVVLPASGLLLLLSGSWMPASLAVLWVTVVGITDFWARYLLSARLAA
jgi:hypothetical protein